MQTAYVSDLFDEHKKNKILDKFLSDNPSVDFASSADIEMHVNLLECRYNSVDLEEFLNLNDNDIDDNVTIMINHFIIQDGVNRTIHCVAGKEISCYMMFYDDIGNQKCKLPIEWFYCNSLGNVIIKIENTNFKLVLSSEDSEIIKELFCYMLCATEGYIMKDNHIAHSPSFDVIVFYSKNSTTFFSIFNNMNKGTIFASDEFLYFGNFMFTAHGGVVYKMSGGSINVNITGNERDSMKESAIKFMKRVFT